MIIFVDDLENPDYSLVSQNEVLSQTLLFLNKDAIGAVRSRLLVFSK